MRNHAMMPERGDQDASAALRLLINKVRPLRAVGGGDGAPPRVPPTISHPHRSHFPRQSITTIMTTSTAAGAVQCEQHLLNFGAWIVLPKQPNPFASLVPRRVEYPSFADGERLDHHNQFICAFVGREGDTASEDPEAVVRAQTA